MLTPPTALSGLIVLGVEVGAGHSAGHRQDLPRRNYGPSRFGTDDGVGRGTEVRLLGNHIRTNCGTIIQINRLILPETRVALCDRTPSKLQGRRCAEEEEET